MLTCAKRLLITQVTTIIIVTLALVRVIVVGTRVVSRRNLREVVEAAYGKSAILGIWAAYGCC